jgi:hypothetical protein
MIAVLTVISDMDLLHDLLGLIGLNLSGLTLRKNLKSETLISDAPIGARLRSGKARRARVGVA